MVNVESLSVIVTLNGDSIVIPYVKSRS